MQLQTEIKITPLKQTVRYGDGLLFLGSCFADEVGGICKGLGFNAMVNPFGVLYNPYSMANAIHRMHSGKSFTRDEVITVGKGYCCTFSHNTEFWKPTENELLDEVNKSLVQASRQFEQAKWLVISLGTAWVYRYRETLEVVANCHKMPSQRFDRFCLSVPQTVTILSDLVKLHPDKQFIFTVSPLRHIKDGLHGNQLSKSTLLLAVDQVCNEFSNVHYFPAYEILLDELRDYRFYKEDMVHPTEQAVRYIWERFTDFAIDPTEKPAMQAAAELRLMLHHKPLFPESDSYRKFELQREQRISELKRYYPNVRLENLK